MKIKHLSLIAITVVFLFSACGDIVIPPKYITINGTQYDMVQAIVANYGTDNDITFREYELSFRDADIDPSTYLNFEIYSNSTTRIQEGQYDYSYAVEKGVISYVEIGINIVYDQSGEAISGTRLTESNSSFDGYITISKNDGDYDFTFNLAAERDSDNKSYSIGGHYNAPLTEGYIYK